MIAKFIFSILVYIGGIFCGDFLFGNFLSNANMIFLAVFSLVFFYFDILNFCVVNRIKKNIRIENDETQKRLEYGLTNVRIGLSLYNIFYAIGLALALFFPYFCWGFEFLTFVYMIIMISTNKKLIKLYIDLKKIIA